MARSDEAHADILSAIDAALADDWARVHVIVQRHDGDPVANWLHAIHHKIEGEHANARYWYARSPMDFARFDDHKVELRAVLHELTRVS